MMRGESGRENKKQGQGPEGESALTILTDIYTKIILYLRLISKLGERKRVNNRVNSGHLSQNIDTPPCQGALGLERRVKTCGIG